MTTFVGYHYSNYYYVGIFFLTIFKAEDISIKLIFRRTTIFNKGTAQQHYTNGGALWKTGFLIDLK